jgi:hypothetical protein
MEDPSDSGDDLRKLGSRSARLKRVTCTMCHQLFLPEEMKKHKLRHRLERRTDPNRSHTCLVDGSRFTRNDNLVRLMKTTHSKAENSFARSQKRSKRRKRGAFMKPRAIDIKSVAPSRPMSSSDEKQIVRSDVGADPVETSGYGDMITVDTW